MSLPSIVSYGAGAKTSTLVWDSDLTIPDGFAIESASGEVGIIGDVSISGSVSAGGNLSADGSISGGGDITAAENLVGVNAVLSNKPLVIGKNVGDASVTLAQCPNPVKNYTSPDFSITGTTENVQYIVPPITFRITSDYSETVTFRLQAKLGDGSYQTIASVGVPTRTGIGSTDYGITPPNTTALRYTFNAQATPNITRIESGLSLNLSAAAVY